MSNEYYEDVEHELYEYDDEGSEDNLCITDPETWQDIHSKELLDIWMSIVEYHETWYLPIQKTFNQLCEFVWKTEHQESPADTVLTPEVQAVQDLPFVKGRNWEEFFLS